MDEALTNNEIVALSLYGYPFKRLLMQRVLWLNPEHIISSRVYIKVPLMNPAGRIIQRCVVVGWRCEQCKATIFAVDLRGLQHAPCCGGV